MRKDFSVVKNSVDPAGLGGRWVERVSNGSLSTVARTLSELVPGLMHWERQQCLGYQAPEQNHRFGRYQELRQHQQEVVVIKLLEQGI